MATDGPPANASAAFPAPPPFYKSFTPANIALLESSSENLVSSPVSTSTAQVLPSSTAAALQYLTPPPLPVSGTYRCFGASHTISPPTVSSYSPPPTQARLRALTRSILLTFLSLTHTLASSPENYGPHWDKLRDLFLEAHQVVNEYRPHQAREALIEMMEEQLRRSREETKGAQEMVAQVKETLEKVANEDDGDEKMLWMEKQGEEQAREDEEDENEEKLVWRLLQDEVGLT